MYVGYGTQAQIVWYACLRRHQAGFIAHRGVPCVRYTPRRICKDDGDDDDDDDNNSNDDDDDDDDDDNEAYK